MSDVAKKETIENNNQIENKKSEETESDSISQILKNKYAQVYKKIRVAITSKNTTVL